MVQEIFILGLVLLITCVAPALVFVGASYGRDRQTAWRIVAVGILSPLVVGVLVGTYWQIPGEPTELLFYLLYFFSCVILSLWFSLPFIALAFLYRRLINKVGFCGIASHRGRFWLMMWTLAGGVVGLCRVLSGFLWDINANGLFIFLPMLVFVFFPISVLFLPDMAVGFFIGWLVARWSESRGGELREGEADGRQATAIAEGDYIPSFGFHLPGRGYISRPSAHVVLRDAQEKVAVIQALQGFSLPGGDQKPGETPEETAVREVREECGLEIEISSRIGIADQFVYSESEATRFRERGTFFNAVQLGPSPSAEADHQVFWASPTEAEALISHKSHQWALRHAES